MISTGGTLLKNEHNLAPQFVQDMPKAGFINKLGNARNLRLAVLIRTAVNQQGPPLLEALSAPWDSLEAAAASRMA